LTFEALEHTAAPAVVRFLARNSLIIVLLHMPLFLALNPVLTASGWPYGARVVVHLVICLPLLGWFSEAVTRVVEPKAVARQLAELTTLGDLRILMRRPSLRPR
jgi:peptidoglycan/LPS O-acetylase OafA/YrhL